MPAFTPLPTLSQLCHWDTEHLSQAADDWEAQAHQLESAFEHNYRRLAATDWQGQGRDAHVARAGLDLAKVRRPAGQLRDAASVARFGFHQQNGAKQSVLDAVADAEAAGFEVNEDLSVNGWFTGTEQAYVAARAQAEALSAQIRHRAALLMSSNHEIATKITAAAGNLGEFRFDEPAGAGPPLDTKPESHDRRAEPTAHVQNAAWVSPTPPAATAPPTDGAALDDGGLVMRLVPPSQVPPSSPTTPTLPAPSGGAMPGTAATPLPAAPTGGSIPRSGGTASGLTAGLAALNAKSAGIAAQASTSAVSGTASVISAPVTAVTQVVPSAAVAAPPQQELHSPDLAAPQPVNPLSAQLLSPGEAQHEQAPPAPSLTAAQHPPAPSQLLTSPPEPVSPPAEPQSGQHSTASGLGSPGIQMLGFGPGGAPQAPPFPIPLDPRPPVPAPPPPPGNPPLRPPSPPSWALPPLPQSVQAAQNELQDLERLIQRHNSHPPNPSDWDAVADYNSEAAYYNAWAAQLHGELDSSNAKYTPATPAQTANVPSWTQPAPQQPAHQGPQVPQKVQDVLKQIDEGKWPQSANAPGTKGGRTYGNVDQHLPTTDGSGKPITYQEWDVNPNVPGQGRGDERIVTGSDGSAWYTTDHYETFQRVR